MGRYYWDKKEEADYCHSLDVFWLKKHGYFDGYKNGGIKWTSSYGRESNISFITDINASPPYIRFMYTSSNRNTGYKEDMDYKAELKTTNCNYGGKRYWIICPLYTNKVYCGRRVATLYFGGSGKYLGCRHCHGLSYSSKNRSKHGYLGGLGRYFDVVNKLEKLDKSIKIHYRNGLPTKKFRKYLQLENELESLSGFIVNMDKMLSK